MIREAIATGQTVEQAFAKACEELGVETTEAEFEILQMPTKKTFGLFGGSPAKVRAYVGQEDEPEQTAPVAAPQASASVKTAPAPIQKGDREDPAESAAAYLKSILTSMNLPQAEISIVREEGGAALTLENVEAGFIIGHRGETLDSLQYLASLVANHTGHSYYRITLDVGSYREKRKMTLEGLGRKMAIRSVKVGRNASLEPMNPYERRIIHTAVQEIAGAKSWSEGNDISRHVVIGPIGGERREGRGNRRPGGNRPRSGGPRSNERRPSGAPAKSQNQSQEVGKIGPITPPGAPLPPVTPPVAKPAPAPVKQDAPSAPIYGKLEKK